MHHRDVQSVVQVMACWLFGTKLLPEPTLAYCKVGPQSKLQLKKSIDEILLGRNYLTCLVWQMSINLFRLQSQASFIQVHPSASKCTVIIGRGPLQKHQTVPVTRRCLKDFRNNVNRPTSKDLNKEYLVRENFTFRQGFIQEVFIIITFRQGFISLDFRH